VLISFPGVKRPVIVAFKGVTNVVIIPRERDVVIPVGEAGIVRDGTMLTTIQNAVRAIVVGRVVRNGAIVDTSTISCVDARISVSVTCVV
jgi:hypothetical protein